MNTVYKRHIRYIVNRLFLLLVRLPVNRLFICSEVVSENYMWGFDCVGIGALYVGLTVSIPIYLQICTYVCICIYTDTHLFSSSGGAWLAQSGECATFDLEVESLSPTLGVHTALKKKKDLWILFPSSVLGEDLKTMVPPSLGTSYHSQ